MSNSKPTDHMEYCIRYAMEQDRERMLCAMMAPLEARPGLVALLAWNIEIAKVGEVASEEMLGFIRFQWWRDALEEIYDGKPPRQHAVVLALAEAIKRYGLKKEPFLRIIAARESDLERAPFKTMEALEIYGGETGGTLLALWLDTLKADNSAAYEAARHIGTAWSLIGTLRATHHLAHRAKVRLPLAEDGGATADILLREGFTPEICVMVEEVAKRAEQHLHDARALKHNIPHAALSPLYLAVQAGDFLRRLKAADYDLTDHRIERGRVMRALKLWRACLFKTY